MEAEHFHLTVVGSGDAAASSWEISTGLTGFSGSSAMQALPDSGVNTQLTTSGPALRYTISFQTPGDYYVYVRGLGPDTTGNSDSIHVGLNGTAVTTSAGTGLTGWGSSSYSWQNSHNGTATIVSIPSAGTYTLDIWMREDGTVIDKIWLSTDPNAVANGDTSLGPSESPRQ